MGSPAPRIVRPMFRSNSVATLLSVVVVHVKRPVVPTNCAKRPQVTQRKRYTMPQRVAQTVTPRAMTHGVAFAQCIQEGQER